MLNNYKCIVDATYSSNYLPYHCIHNFATTRMNIFTILLKELGVKHTSSFAGKLYNEHPYRDSLYGLSKMLSDYKIENVGVRVKDKEQITSYPTPFLAQYGHEFVVVKSIQNDLFTFHWRDQEITHSYEAFCSQWKEVLLLVAKDENSIEPDYKKHLKEGYIRKILLGASLVAVFIFMVLSFIQNALYTSFLSWGLFALNATGCYLTFLLLKKELKISDRYGDKICSLFKKADCNTVLESSSAKIAGSFSWSEIGLSYFLTSLIITLFFPALYSYLALINLIALPYTLWSVWYQAKVAKAWCPLCILCMSLLWGIAIFNLIMGNSIWSTSFSLIKFVEIGVLHLITFGSIFFVIPLIKDARKLPIVTQQMNHVKNKDEVFEAQLKKSAYYEVTSDDSQVIWGNPDADMKITILTNLHCEPCARMHERVKKLLSEMGESISVQYIFSYFNDTLKESNRYLISAYLEDKKQADDLFAEWFRKGKYKREEFYKRHPVNESPDDELEKHYNWKERNKLAATPTILVNGYRLPQLYTIEDIKLITTLDL